MQFKPAESINSIYIHIYCESDTNNIYTHINIYIKAHIGMISLAEVVIHARPFVCQIRASAAREIIFLIILYFTLFYTLYFFYTLLYNILYFIMFFFIPL